MSCLPKLTELPRFVSVDQRLSGLTFTTITNLQECDNSIQSTIAPNPILFREAKFGRSIIFSRGSNRDKAWHNRFSSHVLFTFA